MPEYKNTAGRKKPQKTNKFFSFVRLTIFWLLILTMIVAIASTGAGGGVNYEEKDITEIAKLANDEKLEKIVIEGSTLYVTPREGTDLKNMISRKESSGTLQEQGFEQAINDGKVSV